MTVKTITLIVALSVVSLAFHSAVAVDDFWQDIDFHEYNLEVAEESIIEETPLDISTRKTMALALGVSSDRAIFNTGTSVRSSWISLAGGATQITQILQYPGESMPEGVNAVNVASAGSALPIYSWFEDGTIWFWSEDSKPLLNANAESMFSGLTRAVTIDAHHMDASAATTLKETFYGCRSLTSLDVREWDTSNVTNMYELFTSCSSLQMLDLGHWNTSKVKDMYGLFMACSSLEYVNLSRFDTTSVGFSGGASGLSGLFFACTSLTSADLSSFSTNGGSRDLRNAFVGCVSLSHLTLGLNVQLKPDPYFTNGLSGTWTHGDAEIVKTSTELTDQYYNNRAQWQGTWLRSLPEGHYYRTDGTLSQNNLWEIHTPLSRFKGYCLNLNRHGVGEYLDRVLANDDEHIERLLCTEEQGSVHGSAPLGDSMREALITLIYYGWPNDGAGIQERWGLSDQLYMEITQNAIWDFTDRYGNPAGPSLYSGNALSAYQELVTQHYSNLEDDYILHLYESWDPTKQNLLSIAGLDEDAYGGVSVLKWSNEGQALSGAEFTIYEEDGTEVETIVTGANGEASVCRTDHYDGLPLGNYYIKETKAPAGYKLTDRIYHFSVVHDNEIETIGWRFAEDGVTHISERMEFYDERDETYVGGGLLIQKKSNTGKVLEGAAFSIYDEHNVRVTTILTNGSGIASTGAYDLPMGRYTVREEYPAAGYASDGRTVAFEVNENGKYVQLIDESAIINQELRGTVQFEAQKNLSIKGKEIKAGEFFFQLYDEYDRLLQTKVNDADGKVIFDEITYTADDLGFHNYYIIEVNGEDPNISYDHHREKITVIVDDAGGDSLECIVTYDDGEVSFLNEAKKEEHTVQILKKKLSTQEAAAGAQLRLYDEGGRLLASWTSTAAAKTFQLEAGNYKLTEVSPPSGYEKASQVIFTVAENGSVSSTTPGACKEGEVSITMYDRLISSLDLNMKKTDSADGRSLEGAAFTLTGTDFTGSDYQTKTISDKNGLISFYGLPTGVYTLTETESPGGYGPDGRKWTAEVTVNRYIAKTRNIDTRGVATGTYPSGITRQTITVPGNPESIHVELTWQTEDGFDYLQLLDKNGNIIRQDAQGSAIGDRQGYIWGGLDHSRITTEEFDLSGDTVTFYFYADTNVAGYGYYAVVTTPSTIILKDQDGNILSPENGTYTLTNRERQKVEVRKEWHVESGTMIPDSIEIELLANGGLVQTATIEKAKNWEYTFEDLEKYGTDGITPIDYTVREKNAPKGYHVTITGDKDQGYVITNKELKTVVDDITIEVQKLVNGHYAGGFGFGLYDKNGKELARSSTDQGGHLVLRSSTLRFDTPGTYTYQIRELEDERYEWVTYDTTPVELTIQVFNGEGGLDYTVTYTKNGKQIGRAIFENSYEASGTVEITASKHILGRDWQSGESFLFRLYPVDGAPMRNPEGETPSFMSARAARQGNDTRASFEELYFTMEDLLDEAENRYLQDKDFIYRMEEVIPDEAEDDELNGLRYDNRSHLITVHVHNDRSQEKLRVTYAPGDTQYSTAVEFYNQYTAQAVDVDLQVTKRITDQHGNALTEWKDDAAGKNWQDTVFTFELSRTREDTPMPDVLETELVETTMTQPTASFGTITYTEPGVYSYVIREIVPSQENTEGPVCDGLLYDIVDHSVVIRVTDPGDGQLRAEVRYDDSSATGLTVTNQEVPDAYLYLAVQKNIIGTQPLAGEFNFRLREVHEEGKKALGHDHLGTNDENGSVIFDALVYDHDDLFLWQQNAESETIYYVMEEINDSAPGWTYDTSQIHFRVTVQHIRPETGSHTLEIRQVEYSMDDGDTWQNYDSDQPPVFQNYYEATGEATINISKHLSGREWEQEDAFEFILTGENGAPLRIQSEEGLEKVDSLIVTATEENRIVNFPDIHFSMEDLVQNGVYAEDQTFYYRIHETAAGDTTDGTYISEGITYAEDQVIQVHIHNSSEKGKLSITYTPGSNTLEFPRFYNAYDDSGIRLARISVRKQISGRTWKKGDEFTFQLTPLRNSLGMELEEMPMPSSDQVTINYYSEKGDAADTIRSGSFETMRFTEAGIYEYEISEVNPDKRSDDWIYPEQLHRVVIEIESFGDGTIGEPKIWYAATESQTPAIFVNTYIGKEDDSGDGNNYRFTFTKVWYGEVKDINFKLYNPNGTVYHHAFTRKKVSDTEYLYEAWLATGGDYYVIEEPLSGYSTSYANTIAHMDVKDRVYNGGVITNSAIPRTGDTRNTWLWIGIAAVSVVGIVVCALLIRKKQKS